MVNPVNFGLKSSPFGAVPGTEIVNWAGLHSTKRTLSNFVSSVRPDDIGTSEFIVLYGEYGAGKSHALRFFTNSINMREDGCAIYMSEINLGGKLSFASLYAGIIHEFSKGAMGRFVDLVKEAVQKSAKELEIEQTVKISSEVAIDNLVEEKDRDFVERILNGREFLKKTNNDFEAAQILSSLLRVMTTPIGSQKPPYKAVYLFLDEVESALDAKAEEQNKFFSGIRSIINAVPQHFGLALSFTLQAATLEAALPPYLRERLTRPMIQCEQLSNESAKVFVKEYLECMRPEGYSVSQPFYPFSEAAIDAIFARDAALFPRKILLNMRRVFERSVNQKSLQPGEEISRDMVDEILGEMGI